MVYHYAYLHKVIFSPTCIILCSLEFHLLLSSGHSAVVCSDVLQHISTGSLVWISLFQISSIILKNSGQKGCKPASLLVCWVYVGSDNKYKLNHHCLPFWYRLLLQM